MKELTLLQKKLIILLSYEIETMDILGAKIELEAVKEKVKAGKVTKGQCEVAWRETLESFGLDEMNIQDSKDLQEIDRLLIENFGEGEGLAPEKWKMNRKIRAILKRGIRDADEARMVGDYIDQLADDEEIRKCETLLMEFEMKINDLLQKESISSKSDYTFLSKYRMEMNDDTEGARRIDEMLNNFSKKKG